MNPADKNCAGRDIDGDWEVYWCEPGGGRTRGHYYAGFLTMGMRSRVGCAFEDAVDAERWVRAVYAASRKALKTSAG